MSDLNAQERENLAAVLSKARALIDAEDNLVLTHRLRMFERGMPCVKPHQCHCLECDANKELTDLGVS